MNAQRRDESERLVLGFGKVEDITVPGEVLAGPTENPID
jgi:hypothetical protein